MDGVTVEQNTTSAAYGIVRGPVVRLVVTHSENLRAMPTGVARSA